MASDVNIVGAKTVSKKIDGLLAQYALDQRLAVHKEVGELLLLRLRSNAPVRKSSKVVKRYKSSRKRKTVKGVVYATYAQGNLKRSFSIGEFSSGNVFIGAGRLKGVNPRSNFVGDKADGYYAHMVERGTKYYQGRKFILQTFNQQGILIARRALKLYNKILTDYVSKKGG